MRINRRWSQIMPFAFVTYSLGYLDRANYGFAAAGGMVADLRISPRTSALIGAFFFLGYFFFQIPGAIYAERRSVRKLIFVCLLLWAACATLTGIIGNLAWLLLIRFVLGATEAAVLPAMLIYLGRWFTRRERSRANTFLILGNPVTILWMSVLSGYLIRSMGWRWMFIVEGLPAAAWAVVWWLTTRESPAEVGWLTTDEKQALAEALALEQAGLGAMKNYRAAFRAPVVMILCAQYFLWSIGVYGFVLWLPSILRQYSDRGMVEIGWLSALPYLFAILAMVLCAWIADKTQRRRRWVGVCLLAAAAAFAGTFLAAAHGFWLSYALLNLAGAAMYAPYGPFFAIIPELLPKNVAGGALALINGMGALGSFAGTYIVGALASITGNPQGGFAFMGAALLLAAGLTALVGSGSREGRL